MTRAAAARSLRGTTNQPTEIPKNLTSTAHLGATDLRASSPEAVETGLRVAQSISSVRNAG